MYISRAGLPFVLQTDASDVGLGAILWQCSGNEWRPITFVSRKLYDAESRYTVIEKECLAIKWAITKLHEYLMCFRFTVRTDHAPLQWFSTNKMNNSKLMRWALDLKGYDFTIGYVKGKENFLADVMSRHTDSLVMFKLAYAWQGNIVEN